MGRPMQGTMGLPVEFHKKALGVIYTDPSLNFPQFDRLLCLFMPYRIDDTTGRTLFLGKNEIEGLKYAAGEFDLKEEIFFLVVQINEDLAVGLGIAA